MTNPYLEDPEYKRDMKAIKLGMLNDTYKEILNIKKDALNDKEISKEDIMKACTTALNYLYEEIRKLERS